MNTFSSILFLLLFPVLVFGQSDSLKNKCRYVTTERELQFYGGVQIPEFGKLNTTFKQFGYPALPRNYLSLGLGSLKFRNDRVTGLSLKGYNTTHSSDSFKSSVKSLDEEIFIGYRYLNRKALKMYSMFGLMYTQTSIRQTRQITDLNTFNAYLSHGGNQTEIRNNLFSASLSTHIVYEYKDRRRMIHQAGLRMGYSIPFYEFGWHMTGKKLSGGPKINPGGFYAMLLFAFKI